MRSHEIIFETVDLDLPPKAQAALNRSKRITLKDGQAATLMMATKNEGYAYVAVTATLDGEEVGFLHLAQNNVPPPPDDPTDYDIYKDDRGSWSATNVWVNYDRTRLGIATAMYDYAARAGFKILASGRGYGGKLTPNGQSLWQSREKPLRFGKPLPKQDRFWKPKSKLTRP
jgi:hypothetical protein